VLRVEPTVTFFFCQWRTSFTYIGLRDKSSSSPSGLVKIIKNNTRYSWEGDRTAMSLSAEDEGSPRQLFHSWKSDVCLTRGHCTYTEVMTDPFSSTGRISPALSAPSAKETTMLSLHISQKPRQINMIRISRSYNFYYWGLIGLSPMRWFWFSTLCMLARTGFRIYDTGVYSSPPSSDHIAGI
jgi:hypothetical protein